MNPGDVVTWDAPQRGPVEAKLVKNIAQGESWTVEIQRGRTIIFAIAQSRHLRTPCCGDPGDCASGCAA